MPGWPAAPFLTDPATAASQVNQVISADTRGHISKLVTPDMLTGVGWVLTSALYLDAKWAAPFDPNKTENTNFTTASGATVTAAYLDGNGFSYVKSGGWTAVSLPYAGGKLTMTALLPPAGSAACTLPTQPGLAAITASLRAGGTGAQPGTAVPARTAAVFLPKVNLAVNGPAGDMKAVLSKLGMGQAFTDAADFTGLSRGRRASLRSCSRPPRCRWARRARSAPPRPPSACIPPRRSTPRSSSSLTVRT